MNKIKTKRTNKNYPIAHCENSNILVNEYVIINETSGQECSYGYEYFWVCGFQVFVKYFVKK